MQGGEASMSFGLFRAYQHRSCTGLLNKDCIKTLQPTMLPGGLLSKVDHQDTSPPKTADMLKSKPTGTF